ncbi:MAG TPA: hypothetical protein VEU33_22960 [Archangium sp.]|nr:hypothetical protein [Archangium sp.]
MTLQQTIDYARRRFVELWVRLLTDHPGFQEGEGELRRNEVTETVTEARDVLDQGEALPAEWNALVQLQALDEFLAEHSGTSSTGVDIQLGLPVRMEDGQVHFLYRRPQGMKQALVIGKMGHLRRWARHHQVLPEQLRGYQIALIRPSDYLFQQLSLMQARRERLKVAFVRFEDGVTPKWMAQHLPQRLRAETLTDPETRWATMSRFLDAARSAGAHVLVLPELTVSPELRLRVQGWLDEQSGNHSLLMVLPGTFHERDNKGKPGEVVNRTELLDAYGQPLLVHHKLLRFGGWEGAVEDINVGKRIELLSLPLGLLTIPICLDFCEADQPLPEVWKELAPAWLLVSALGDGSSRRAHATAAKSLFTTRRSITVLANQPKTPGAPAPGFVCDSPGRDPTRWDDETPGASFEMVEVDISLEDP